MRYRLLPAVLALTMTGAISGCVSVTPSVDNVMGESVIELAGAPTPTPSLTPTLGELITLDLQAELKVEAQSGSGVQVKLDEVRVGRANTLLVIQTSSGELLGTVLLNPGSEPLGIPLSIPLTSSGLLSASLYLDDGDRIFNASKDSIIIDEEGAVMRVFFEYRVSVATSTPQPSSSSESPMPSPEDSPSSEDESESEDEDRDTED